MSRLTLVRISVQGFEGSGFTTLKLQGEETVQQVKNTVLGKIQSKGLTGDEDLKSAEYGMERRKNVGIGKDGKKNVKVLPLVDDSKLLDAFATEIKANSGYKGLIFVLYLVKRAVATKTAAETDNASAQTAASVAVPSTEAALAVLKAGSNFLLLSQGAKPEKIRLAYKQDSLVWHPSDPSKRIPVSVKLALTVGTEDPAFASVKGRQGIDDENCFSLFYGDSGVMFLAAEDGNVLANWLVGVNHLQGCAAAVAPSSTEADDFTQRLNRASVSYQTAPEQKAFSSSSTLQTVSETAPAVGNDALQAAFAEQSKALQLMIQAQISQSLASLVVGENKIVDPAALELDAHTELELLKITLEEYSATIEAQQNTITKLKDQLAQKDKQSKAFETRVTQLVRKNSMDSLQGGRERTASFDQLETFAV